MYPYSLAFLLILVCIIWSPPSWTRFAGAQPDTSRTNDVNKQVASRDRSDWSKQRDACVSWLILKDTIREYIASYYLGGKNPTVFTKKNCPIQTWASIISCIAVIQPMSSCLSWFWGKTSTCMSPTNYSDPITFIAPGWGHFLWQGPGLIVIQYWFGGGGRGLYGNLAGSVMLMAN